MGINCDVRKQLTLNVNCRVPLKEVSVILFPAIEGYKSIEWRSLVRDEDSVVYFGRYLTCGIGTTGKTMKLASNIDSKNLNCDRLIVQSAVSGFSQ